MIDKLQPYFSYDEKDIKVRIKREGSFCWSLSSIRKMIREKGVQGPYTIHFENILMDQYLYINEQFSQHIDLYQYKGSYTFAYPVKVNAKRHVYDSLKSCKQYPCSFEVGSKPELMIALSQAQKDAFVICNGIKGDDYLMIANQAALDGAHVFIVIENAFEIDQLKRFLTDVPLVGFKVGFRVKGWANSATKFYDKFGLGVSSIQKLSKTLKNLNRANLLALIHFHNVWASSEQLKQQINYTFKVYAELLKLHPIQYIDCGGGVFPGGSDDGYYDVKSYADCVISSFKSAARKFNVPEPSLITESGSALMYATELLLVEKIGEVHLDTEKKILHEKSWLESENSLDDFVFEDDCANKKNIWLNFSVFNSMPDVWGLNKTFPVLNIDSDSSLSSCEHVFDSTCDPDGRIELTGHSAFTSGSTYVFLFIGAYQHMLASAHNLLARPAQIVVKEVDNRPVVELVSQTSNEQMLNDFGYFFEPGNIQQNALKASTYSQVPSCDLNTERHMDE